VLRVRKSLLLAFTLVWAGGAGAQEIVKPRVTTTTTDRLPKPTTASAAQEPDGRIRVVWNAVEGAVSYVGTDPRKLGRAMALLHDDRSQFRGGQGFNVPRDHHRFGSTQPAVRASSVQFHRQLDDQDGCTEAKRRGVPGRRVRSVG
jgi:hypothetical protein